jgi:hypothetical protein
MRLTGAVFIKQHEKWSSGKKYFDKSEFIENPYPKKDTKIPEDNPDQTA